MADLDVAEVAGRVVERSLTWIPASCLLHSGEGLELSPPGANGDVCSAGARGLVSAPDRMAAARLRRAYESERGAVMGGSEKSSNRTLNPSESR